MPILLRAVRVGQPRKIDGSADWFTGFFKEPVEGPVRLSKENLAGDRQADPKVHGGPDKAVCVYSGDHYGTWRRELGVEECGPGWFGENFSVEGQMEADACIGDVYRIGSARVEISQPRGPCWKLARRWGRQEFVDLVVHSGRSGWYLRVLEEGAVSAGQPLTLLERPHPQWTIARVNELTHARSASPDAIAARLELSACSALAQPWRARLTKNS